MDSKNLGSLVGFLVYISGLSLNDVTAFFLSLSLNRPFLDLLALVTDDIMDCAAFEQLLLVGFSTPSFEQVSSLFLANIDIQILVGAEYFE